jgi:hypothetical protein
MLPKVHYIQHSHSLKKLNKQTKNIFSISFLNNCNVYRWSNVQYLTKRVGYYQPCYIAADLFVLDYQQRRSSRTDHTPLSIAS